MSFNSIYVNGSSFSCGNGLDLIEIKKIYKEKLNIEIPNHIDFSYPNIIATNFKTKIINEAVPGGSLNRLIRKTYQFIFDKKNISKNTLFILELPPMWRDEFYSNKLDRFINITWGTIKNPTKDLTNIRNGYDVSDILKIYDDLTNCFDNFINVDLEAKKSFINLLGLISYMSNVGLKFILIDCAGFKEFLNHNAITNDYNFLFFDNKKMHHWIVDNKLTINDELGVKIDAHAGIVGNKKIASILSEYIKNNF